MERCLLVALIVFPFAVLLVSAWPVVPGTTATFLASLLGYGGWLGYQRLRERNDDERPLARQ